MTKTAHFPLKRIRRTWLALCAVLALILTLFTPVTARADGGLTLSTPYPGMMVKAGDSVSVSLDISNSSGSAADVSLQTLSLPDGWEGYFNGGGKQITSVHVPAQDTFSDVSFQMTVPTDASEGEYQVRLQAVSDTGLSDVMTLTFTISETRYGQSSFTTEYPEQEGASGTTFTFNTTLVNNGAESQSYSLSSQAPDGWQVSFKPSGESTQIAAIDIDSAGSQGINVTVVPPSNVEAGSYTIACSAISAGETMNLDLKVNITGTYALQLSTPSGLLSFDTTANKASAVTLSVTNLSNVTLENINLTSSAPSGWTVEFDTSTIESLEAGATQEVVAHITPGEDAMTGDYVTTITASSSETSDTAEFRVTVKTATVWGFVAIAIIVLLAGGLGYVFRKYGRR